MKITRKFNQRTTIDSNQEDKEDSDEENCSTCEDKIRLFQKYISCKILLQSSRYEILLNLKVLSRFTNLLFFNVNFPKEIITFINTVYIELRRKSIAVDFDLEKLGHLCPCDEHVYCHEQWYDIVNERFGEWIDDNEKLEKSSGDTYPNPFEWRWYIYQCDVEKQDYNPKICHKIFCHYDGEEREEGFFCRGCGQTCCLECRSYNDYCYECFRPGDYT